ncbi:unnamed protein product [Eruca vesicaria subsp. sativa]|uniref:Myb-like domain-containing protein n=1 Tax=Eruca vesicaria subsp. sativa TaxID=29727 RepID=A0ABC8LCE3_ERUVS|nr:unnamed protein product [Eruca vesicaria subsp. sativa]
MSKKRVRISSPPGSDSDNRAEENQENENRKGSCYVCDVKDDWVLVCHGEECLISIHQSCTCVEPDFDEFGNFFCPYCWYKRLVLKSLNLRDKLLVIDKSRGVSKNVNECDESYEKFMALEKDQRRKEVFADETQSQDNEQEEDHCDSKVQELALVIHQPIEAQQQPIEAQPFRTVPPENGGTALHDPKQRKRKRVFWTKEEEEMLKVGVEKFPGVRNIPWRKILEFGRGVFHEDRAPSDLKDKWKLINKICGKPPLN